MSFKIDFHDLTRIGNNLKPVLADVSLAAAVPARPGFFPASPDLADANSLTPPDKFKGDAGFPAGHAGYVNCV
jgi:hypothetical protein